MSRTRRLSECRTVCSVLIALAAIGACADPLSPVFVCESQAIATLARQEGPVGVRCDLGREVYLLALPAGERDQESLMKLGLPENARFIVPDTDRATWCIVEEHAPFQTPSFEPQRNFVSTCTSSSVRIQSPIGARSSVFLLSFVADDSEQVAVTSITEQ